MEFNFDDFGTKAVKAILAEIEILADDAVGYMQALVSTPYPPPSSPGNPPHLRTGDLQASISHTDVDNSGSFEVGSDSPYADFLEGGTSKMDPRPFVLPTYDWIEKEAPERIRKALGGIR